MDWQQRVLTLAGARGALTGGARAGRHPQPRPGLDPRRRRRTALTAAVASVLAVFTTITATFATITTVFATTRRHRRLALALGRARVLRVALLLRAELPCVWLVRPVAKVRPAANQPTPFSRRGAGP